MLRKIFVKLITCHKSHNVHQVGFILFFFSFKLIFCCQITNIYIKSDLVNKCI